MSKINSVKAREILDPRGNPMVEADTVLDNGVTGWATAPSGASIGTREAVELRDDDKSRLHGKGVKTVVENVTKAIVPKVVDVDALERRKMDQLFIALDGMKNKSRLGVSVTLGVPMTVARAASSFLNILLFKYIDGLSAYELPVFMINTLNGGKYADNMVDVQEFMIMPIDTDSFATALRMYSEAYQVLKVVIKDRGMSIVVDDEGGFIPNLVTNEDALKLITEAIEKIGYRSGEGVSIVSDPTASESYTDGKYVFQGEKTSRSSEEMIALYSDWINKYPTVSLEDGLAKDDWGGWAILTAKFDNRVQLVSGDIFVMNPEILQGGISKHIANSILARSNQIGTFSETFDTIQMVRMAGYVTMVSHRFGGTGDTTMVNTTAAVNTEQVRNGVPRRTERIMKYDQLLWTEKLLGDSARSNGMAVKRQASMKAGSRCGPVSDPFALVSALLPAL